MQFNVKGSQEFYREKGRKSHLDVFCKKGVLKKFALYIGRYLDWNLSNKVEALQSVDLSRRDRSSHPVVFLEKSHFSMGVFFYSC